LGSFPGRLYQRVRHTSITQYEILNALIQARGATVTTEHLSRTIYRNTVTPDACCPALILPIAPSLVLPTIWA